MTKLQYDSESRLLLDEDGENRALRTFLLQYGLPGLRVGAMRDHMKRSGWGAEYWPFFVTASKPDAHLTKAGAQLWIRHLLSLEKNSNSREIEGIAQPSGNPGELDGWKLVPLALTEDMLISFAEVWYSKKRCIDDCEMADCYAAMLDAAPTPAKELK